MRALVAAWTAGAAVAAYATDGESKPPRQRLETASGACLAKARALLRADNPDASDDPSHRLKPVSEELAARLKASGISLGRLAITSMISPPSEFALVQLPATEERGLDGRCPLHEIYLSHRQGGFVPQPVRYFGPLAPAPE